EVARGDLRKATGHVPTERCSRDLLACGRQVEGSMVVRWRPCRAAVLAALLAPGLAGHATAQTAQLTLTWTDNSANEDGFGIERKIGTSGTYGQIATIGANATSYTDTGLTAGTTYCYRTFAFNVTGSSPYSNEACAAPASLPSVTISATTATATEA